jgi:hypothetical protein
MAQHGCVVAEVMFSVLTCFQFHVYPVRQFLAYNVRKLRGRSASDGEKTDVSCYGRSMTRWYDIIGALCCSVEQRRGRPFPELKHTGSQDRHVVAICRPDNETMLLKERITCQYFADL